LFNRTNSRELVGKTGIWDGQLERAVAASYLIRVRVNEQRVRPRFVWAWMNMPFFKRLLEGQCRHAIGMANIQRN
jgi:type I restriction enzyme, S subunit